MWFAGIYHHISPHKLSNLHTLYCIRSMHCRITNSSHIHIGCEKYYTENQTDSHISEVQRESSTERERCKVLLLFSNRFSGVEIGVSLCAGFCPTSGSDDKEIDTKSLFLTLNNENNCVRVVKLRNNTAM